jgi:NADH-quinone oxidoreductase subunit E
MESIIISNLVETIINKYNSPQKKDLGKILLDMQNEYGYLNEEIIKKVSNYLGISATEAYGFASFYSLYNLEKPGKYIIKICKGTACHIKNSTHLIRDIENYLGLKIGETTKDGLITFDVSTCLGVCALSPVLMINDRIYTRVNLKIVKSLIDDLRIGEKNE